MFSKVRSSLTAPRGWIGRTPEMPQILEAIKRGTSGNQTRKPTRAEIHKQASLLLELERSPSIPANAYEDANTLSERLREV